MLKILLRFLPGISSPWMLVGGLAAVIGIYGAGFWTGARVVKGGEVKTLELQVAQQQTALQDQADEAKRLNGLLAAREQKRALAARSAAKWRRKWQQEQKNDQSCQKWADTRLPECAVRMLDLSTYTGAKGYPLKPDAAKSD